MKSPRLFGWLIATIVLVCIIGLLAPQQLPVSLYKLSLVTMAGVVGYWLDRSLFPYARPDSYLKHDWRGNGTRCEMDADHQIAQGYTQVFAAAMLRRAIIVGAVVVGVALGL